MSEWFKKIRQNHLLMMILCCAVPLAIVFGAVYWFGAPRSYLYWLVLLLCPLMHFFMMKDMHKTHGAHKEHAESANQEKPMKKGGCH